MVSYLIPVVTATCPRRLNHPVIHDASGALDGFDNIAAQKYGPPDVGCALQISGNGHTMRTVPVYHMGAAVPAIERPTIIVKKAWRVSEKPRSSRGGTLTDSHEAPHHYCRPSSILPATGFVWGAS